MDTLKTDFALVKRYMNISTSKVQKMLAEMMAIAGVLMTVIATPMFGERIHGEQILLTLVHAHG